MANGMILRGEVYWVSLDDSAGSEIKTGRPAVIVSGDSANEKEDTVIVAFITSGGVPSPHNVTVMAPEGKKRVLCRQLRTVDKTRLTRFEYKLTAPEMIRVTGALSGSLCIPLRTPEYTAQEKENKEIAALKSECEMWKRCYDAVMNQLVDMKVNNDLALRLSRVEEYEEPEEIEEFEEAEVEVVEEPEPEIEEPEAVVEETPVEPAVSEPAVLTKVNINTATIKEIAGHLNTNTYYAGRITSHRNKNGKFVDLEELKMVEGLPKHFYDSYAHLCTIGEQEKPEVVEEQEEFEEFEPEPVEEAPDKVNLNTATAKEISDISGMHINYCYYIVKYRKDNGPFAKLDELLNVKLITPGVYAKYKDRMTIGGPDGYPEEPEKAKLNVNTATAQEISDVTGWHVSTCYAITGKRKREGNFKSLDELVTPNRISENQLNRVRHLLTVGEIQEEQESGKVNINTANMYDLMGVGFEKRAAALIVNERKKYGRFRSVDDLAKISEISGKILRKLRDKLEV